MLEIIYKTNKLQKQLTIPREMIKAYGERAKKLKQRMSELQSADCLATMRKLPAVNCHELKGDRNGQLAVDISKNFRLIFIPNHNPNPKTKDGGLDWSSITKIKIIEVEDYH